MSILDELIAGAKEVYSDTKILQILCIVQGVHESRLLGKPTVLAEKYNNLFGIKKPGTAGTCVLTTWEYLKGKKVTLKATFGANRTVMDSCKQHRDILSLPRYAPVWHKTTLEDAARAIRECGYATDPSYTTRLIETYQELLKKKFI